MSVALEKRYSKAKANANHIVWTGREVIPVNFYVGGLIYDSLEFGNFRVTGRDMYCSGYRIDFQRPAGSQEVVVTANLYTGNGGLVPNTSLRIAGTQIGRDATFPGGSLAFPEGSIWFIRMSVTGDEAYYPESATVSYWMRYANGPVSSQLWSPTLSEGGIGFWGIGEDFVVP